MLKHIGIIAVSAGGASLCYETICELAWKKFGKFENPEISMHMLPLKDYMKHIKNDKWEEVAKLMLISIKKLVSAGADFAISPDNTVHIAFKDLKKKSPIPLLIAEECKTKKYKKVGILGTKYTIQSAIYEEELKKLEIDLERPTEEEQESINKTIFKELAPGQIKKSASKVFIEIIKKLKARDCEAVILGCTEIPLVIDNDNSPLPVLDSTRLLAKKAFEYSTSLKGSKKVLKA
jgi:aspartate racemase